MPSVYCVLCGNRDKSVSYFAFPKEENIRKQWLAFCGINEQVLNTVTKLCTNHFREEDIIKKPKRSYMKPNTVPFIHGKKGTRSLYLNSFNNKIDYKNKKDIATDRINIDYNVSVNVLFRLVFSFDFKIRAWRKVLDLKQFQNLFCICRGRVARNSLVVFLAVIVFPEHSLFSFSDTVNGKPATSRIRAIGLCATLTIYYKTVPLCSRYVHCTLTRISTPPFSGSSGTPEVCTFQETTTWPTLARQHFAQSVWLRDYIELNTQFRTRAKNDFEKNLYKLMNNAVFGKTMENVRNHNLITVEPCKLEMKFNKPIYVGILDISKVCLMIEFYHEYMMYQDKCKIIYTRIFDIAQESGRDVPSLPNRSRLFTDKNLVIKIFDLNANGYFPLSRTGFYPSFSEYLQRKRTGSVSRQSITECTRN
ncbi:hypothetical protein ALC60_11890 [Trachymyrmex zeteki]|uniref:THAP-type domain-containing protein n=1 Tax=Mycetomoellerius zeteki TaxID=64791 RepID=A0A151WLY7_9HYME|nr:hypothetical protein ALC60_11890 [Trachymyrmex zeteki]